MTSFAQHESGPFVEHVGPFEAGDDGSLRVVVAAHHRNAAGTAHGGLLATLVDSTIGHAVREALEGDGRPVTVSLTTDFLGPAAEGDVVVARAEVERLGGRLAFADCSLRVEDREIVRARGVFAVLEAE